MHKLKRDIAPACLARCAQEGRAWQNLSSADTREIRSALETMQGSYCAYCEAVSDDKSKNQNQRRHIEHFRPRAKFPELTYCWDNLFLSCSNSETCGKHKDKKGLGYSPDEVLNPCLDDPDRFLRFYANGRVEPARGISEADKRRADETIRVFNLNAPSLVERRKNVLCAWEWLKNSSSDKINEYVSAILDQGQPFPTAVRHVLVGK